MSVATPRIATEKAGVAQASCRARRLASGARGAFLLTACCLALTMASATRTGDALAAVESRSSEQDSIRFEALGHLGGSFTGIAGTQDHPFVGSVGALQVYALRNDAMPRLVSELAVATTDNLRDLQHRNGLLYAAAGRQGLLIFDVTDPLNPLQLSALPIAERSFESLVLDGNRVLMPDGDVYVIDVRDPRAPRIEGLFFTPRFAQTIFRHGRRAFVGEHDGSRRFASAFILDLDTGAGLLRANLGRAIGGVFDIVGMEDQVVLATWSGLSAYRLRGAEPPQLLGQVSGPMGRLVLAGETLFALSAEGLLRLELDGERGMVLREHMAVASREADLWLDGDRLYIADWLGGLATVSIDPAGVMAEIASARLPGFAASVLMQDGIAFLATGGGVQILDLSDPRQPRTLGRIPEPEPASYWRGIALDGDRLALYGSGLNVSTRRKVFLYEIARPQTVRRLGSIDMGGIVADVVMQSGTLFASLESDQILSYRIDDPAEPILLDALSFEGTPGRISLSGDHLYLLETRYSPGQPEPIQTILHDIDVSRPDRLRPRAAGEPLAFRPSCLVQDGRIALLCGSFRSAFYHLGDNAAPRRIDPESLPELVGATAAHFDGDVLLVTRSPRLVPEIAALDFGVPGGAVVASSSRLSGQPSALGAIGWQPGLLAIPVGMRGLDLLGYAPATAGATPVPSPTPPLWSPTPIGTETAGPRTIFVPRLNVGVQP